MGFSKASTTPRMAFRDGRVLDEGLFAATRDPQDRGRFKTPTLREVAGTAPYMHDGSGACPCFRPSKSFRWAAGFSAPRDRIMPIRRWNRHLFIFVGTDKGGEPEPREPPKS